MCLGAPKITYVNMSFFFFHSCFLPILHHYTHTDPIPTQTGGELREPEEIQALKKPNEQHWTWCRRPDISAGILTSSPSDNVVLTLDYSNMF